MTPGKPTPGIVQSIRSALSPTHDAATYLANSGLDTWKTGDLTLIPLPVARDDITWSAQMARTPAICRARQTAGPGRVCEATRLLGLAVPWVRPCLADEGRPPCEKCAHRGSFAVDDVLSCRARRSSEERTVVLPEPGTTEGA